MLIQYEFYGTGFRFRYGLFRNGVKSTYWLFPVAIKSVMASPDAGANKMPQQLCPP